MVLSSDKFSNLNEPMLFLYLDIFDGKKIVLELTKSEVDNLLGDFQKINKVCFLINQGSSKMSLK